MDNQNILEKYFTSAREQELSLSYDEVKQNFLRSIDVGPGGNSGAPPSDSSSSLWEFLNSFFSIKINVVYTFISLGLIGTLIFSLSTDSKNYKETTYNKDEGHLSEESMAYIPPHNEKRFDLASEVERSQVKEETEQELEEVENIVEVEVEEDSTQNESNPKTDKLSEELAKLTEINKSKDAPDNEPVKTKEKPSVKKQQNKPKSKYTKPAYHFTFTPNTPETRILEEQKKLKKEGVDLIFTKLKYKDGVIQKIEGTIELDGYHGTFYSDEFDDFTFKWTYPRTKGGMPAEFDIIVNTPMERKSNTDVRIEELE